MEESKQENAKIKVPFTASSDLEAASPESAETQTLPQKSAETQTPPRKSADAEAARIKGQETRRRRYEQRMEKQRLASLAEEQKRIQQQEKDERFMKEALHQAQKAAAIGDVPIGCVIVYRDRIIARGYNRRNADNSVLSHAEIICIKKSCKKLGDWRLEDCTMYVTLEPCPMCAGAIVQARILRVAIGCMNPKAGCAGSVLDMLHEPGFNHQVQVAVGILEKECSGLMAEFFQTLRRKKTV